MKMINQTHAGARAVALLAHYKQEGREINSLWVSPSF
jgi:hypothetical protein